MGSCRWVLLLFLVSAFLISGCSSFSHSYQTDLLRAEQSMRDGKLPEALALYERAIPKIPVANKQEHAAALINAGNCLASLQKLNEAFADFQKATEVDPENLDARLHLAEFFIAAGVPNHAREHLEFVLSRNPEDAAALGMLGTI